MTPSRPLGRAVTSRRQRTRAVPARHGRGDGRASPAAGTNHVLHSMAVVQLRTRTTEGRAYYDRKVTAG